MKHSNDAFKTAFDIQVDGKRGPGRPKMTWKQLTERDCREWKLSAIDPHDRRTWRSGVRSAMPAASQLSGRVPLMWMLPLYLHVNQKSDYDMMMMIYRALDNALVMPIVDRHIVFTLCIYICMCVYVCVCADVSVLPKSCLVHIFVIPQWILKFTWQKCLPS